MTLIFFGAAMAALIFIIMALALRPRTSDDGAGEAAYDITVYRDQLAEIDRDLARGAIGDEEAKAAKLEISRRLLTADKKAMEADDGQEALTSPALVAGVLIAAMIAGAGVYLWGGAPTYRDLPFMERVAETLDQPSFEEMDEETLALALREAVQENPNDPRGWALLGPLQMRLGDFQGAAASYARLIELDGPTVERLGNFGEAVVLASEGEVTAQAADAFRRALALDDQAIRPRFYLAVAEGQGGDLELAIKRLIDLENTAPEEAPWRPRVGETVREAMAALGEQAQGEAREEGEIVLAIRRPFADILPDASLPTQAAPAERPPLELSETEMRRVESMVAGLAAELEARPLDPNGWARLMQSYMVLGRPEEASAALERAVVAFDGEPEIQARLRGFAEQLGLTPDPA